MRDHPARFSCFADPLTTSNRMPQSASNPARKQSFSMTMIITPDPHPKSTSATGFAGRRKNQAKSVLVIPTLEVSYAIPLIPHILAPLRSS